MSDAEIFGPLILGSDVEDGAITTLQTWMPLYIAMVSRKIGQAWDWLQVPKSYTAANDPNHWPEDQVPAIVVACPGTEGQPKRDGRQTYRAKWQLEVVVFVSANDRPATEKLAKYYGGAVRMILAQKADLNDLAAGTQWNSEKYNIRIADQDQRVLGSCSNTFCVDVRNVVRALGGPPDPNADPSGVPPDYPLAEHVTVQLVPEALS